MDQQLKEVARSLVWWKPPEEVDFLYLVRRVMEMGTPEMVTLLRKTQGDATFRQAIETAEPGNFSERSWNYWHVVLGLGPTPPLPRRQLSNLDDVPAETRHPSRGSASPLAQIG